VSAADTDPGPGGGLDPVRVTRATYERVATAYEARNSTVAPDLAAWRDDWVATLPRDRWVLDAGAGPGWHAAAFEAASPATGRRAVALDLAVAMARLARGRGVPVVLGDQRRLPFADAAFGGVWSSAALLHVPRADVPATLAEWRRVTTAGGGLALGTATAAPDGWEDSPYAMSDGGPGRRWFTYHDPDALAALAGRAGWTVTSLGRDTGERREWIRLLALAR
jgi:SAM-dependent methyltransferase